MFEALLDFLRYVLPCRSVLSLKKTAILVLFPALLLDFTLRAGVSWSADEGLDIGLTLFDGEDRLAIAIVCAITLLALVLADTFLSIRTTNTRERLLLDYRLKDELKKELARRI